jgi:outer membrane lipase/esterase
MRSKMLASASAVALVFAAGLGAAGAQTYSNVVTFGDSLSDNGNVFRQNPAAATANTPYLPLTNGRFSNGPVWAEILAGAIRPGQFGPTGTMVGVGGPIPPGVNANLAFGGARTDAAVNQLPPGPGAPPAIREQVGLFALSGGRYGPQTLVTIWGGANNAFQQIPVAAAAPATALATMQGVMTAAAGDIAAAAQGSISQGARNILVANLPDLGSTPAFAGGPAQTLASVSSLTFNAQLAGRLNALAAANPGVNIIQMDVARLFQNVLANPGQFGFSNTTGTCVTSACATNPAQAASFVFWDPVHPTAAVHQRLAGYAMDHVMVGQAGASVAPVADIALSNRQQGMDAVLARISGAHAPAPAGNGAVSVVVEGRSLRGDARGAVPSYSATQMSARLVVDRAFAPGLTAGFAASFTQSNASAGTARNLDSTGAGFDAYVSWRSGGFLVNAVAGAGLDQFDDIRRQSFLGVAMNGQTRGTSYGGALQLGYQVAMGAVTVTPLATIAAVRTRVDAFTEDGLSVAYSYAGRGVTALTGEIALRADARIGDMLSAYAIVGYRGNLSYSADALSVSLANNTALPVAVAVGKPNANAIRLGAGLQGAINNALSFGIAYDGAISGSGSTHTGRANVTVRF